MNCPYCHKEMRSGWIQSRDGLGWSEKKRVVAALAGLLARWNCWLTPRRIIVRTAERSLLTGKIRNKPFSPGNGGAVSLIISCLAEVNFVDV